jgi:hypothetical protein
MLANSVQQPACLPGDRVGLKHVGEGRGFPQPRAQCVGRLAEAYVEVGATSATCDMDQIPVEYQPLALVLVQTEMEVLS